MCRNLRPTSSEEAKQVEEKMLKRNSIAWSEVESSIGNTDADVLLIFDCCNAGRLCRPYRALGRSYFEFLGACSENQTTEGPGDGSFTRALTWALKKLAKKEEAFSTSELRHVLMSYEKFPKEQIPVLSDRRMPGEHIVIARKGLDFQYAPKKCERAKELQNREYIDVRFHFDHKIASHHFDATADALKSLVGSSGAYWSRVAFLEQNSIVEKTAMKWKELTRSRKKSMSTSPVHPPKFLDNQVPSPDVERTLSPRMPTHSYTPLASGRNSRASSMGPGWERTPLITKRAESRKRTANEDSVMFHVKAIGRRMRAVLSAALTWLTDKVRPVQLTHVVNII